MINLFFIEKYIKKITKEDIYNYAITQKITLTEQELNILFNYLKTKYKLFFTNPTSRAEILSEIKSQVNPKTAKKIDELYELYKNKI